jgi:uncharacterized membrane-anchored protein
MTRRRRNAFVLVVALQLLLPLALIAWNEVALARGTEVTLRTVPVDPIDLVRGRYVTLRYPISNLPVPEAVEPGDTVYVPLHREGDAWTGEFVTAERPDGLFIRGRYGGGSLVYGIETYYADEATAQRLERAAGVLVRVSIGSDGHARIKGVEVR